jgi:hypothetical protein
MPIQSTILDGSGTALEAAVVKKDNLPAGIVTYNAPAESVIGQTKAITNPTYGLAMNIDAQFSGTPEGVHNGTDSVLWSATALSGTWDFASTTQAFAGTKSVEAINTVDGNEAQFEDTGTTDTSAFTAVSGAIYITGWPTSGTKEVELRLRLAGVDVGNIISLSGYIDVSVLNAWQTFAIPIADFGTGGATVDQMIVKTVDLGGGAPPDYYLDAIQFEEVGSEVYSVSADANSFYTINSLNIAMADAFNSTLADSSMPKIPYNTLLGVSKLANGIGFKLTTGGVVRFNSTFQQHIDFMAFPRLSYQSGGDATNTWMNYSIEFNPGFVLDGRIDDKLEVTLADDLSGLLYMRMLVRGGKVELT